MCSKNGPPKRYDGYCCTVKLCAVVLWLKFTHAHILCMTDAVFLPVYAMAYLNKDIAKRDIGPNKDYVLLTTKQCTKNNYDNKKFKKERKKKK